jgi:hypothetical protein
MIDRSGSSEAAPINISTTLRQLAIQRDLMQCHAGAFPNLLGPCQPARVRVVILDGIAEKEV